MLYKRKLSDPISNSCNTGDTRVHVSCSYGGDMSTEIEGMVNKEFCLRTILGVPNVKPDNGYI